MKKYEYEIVKQVYDDINNVITGIFIGILIFCIIYGLFINFII